MAAAKLEPILTIADLDAMPEDGNRYEVIEGELIEILSPGTENERRDRHAKRQLYRKYGVKEYWIVDPERSAIAYRTSKLKLVAKLEIRDQVTTPLLPGFRCSVRDILQ